MRPSTMGAIRWRSGRAGVCFLRVPAIPAPGPGRERQHAYTLPNGLPSRVCLRYTRRLCENRLRVLPTMEINPILNSIKDLSERSETIRGYL